MRERTIYGAVEEIEEILCDFSLDEVKQILNEILKDNGYKEVEKDECDA
jgi:hypothetical protein